MDVQISSRLMPGIPIGGAWVQAEPTQKTDSNGKPLWHWVIDLPDGSEHEGTDLAGWGDAGEMLRSLLSFLSACAEGRNFENRTGRASENSGLFSDEVGAWAEENSDEISMAEMELGGGED